MKASKQALAAAGVGRRMGSDRPKQYLSLCGQTVIEQTIAIFRSHPRIKGIVVALSSDDPYWSEIEARLSKTQGCPIMTVDGGEERCHSVLNALNTLQVQAEADDWVMVHDAARPCLRREDLQQLIDTAVSSENGAILGARVRDTMKRSDQHGVIIATEERENLWHALTPQMFTLQRLTEAYQTAISARRYPTDEAAAIEAMGDHPLMVEGAMDNIKITLPEDLLLAEFFLKQRGQNR